MQRSLPCGQQTIHHSLYWLLQQVKPVLLKRWLSCVAELLLYRNSSSHYSRCQVCLKLELPLFGKAKRCLVVLATVPRPIEPMSLPSGACGAFHASRDHPLSLRVGHTLLIQKKLVSSCANTLISGQYAQGPWLCVYRLRTRGRLRVRLNCCTRTAHVPCVCLTWRTPLALLLLKRFSAPTRFLLDTRYVVKGPVAIDVSSPIIPDCVVCVVLPSDWHLGRFFYRHRGKP